jgi:hydroxyacylglutathione hydrolase
MALTRRIVVAATMAAAILVVSVVLAPRLYAELAFQSNSLPFWPKPSISGNPLPGAATGSVIDGYWRVQLIAPDTYAIAEPQGEPDNVEYLLIGEKRALLIDAGATNRDIHAVLATLTQLPVTVIPTHLHYDHTNGLTHFSAIAMLDIPETRSRVRDNVFHLGRYQYLANTERPVFSVTEWVRPGAHLDLGGRQLKVLWTPGHTTSSVSIYDPAAKQLFTGDWIYPTTVYAFAPDSSLSTYEATVTRLLDTLPTDTIIYGGHCCRNDQPLMASWLDMNDLRDLQHAVANARSGSAAGLGLILRRFPVNSRMTLVTLYPFGNW